MPMPHRTQQQLIKRRLVGKDGAERIRELRAILDRAARLPQRPVRRPAEVGRGRARCDADAEEGRPSRLDRGAPRGRGADRARRARRTRASPRSCRRCRRSRSARATTRSPRPDRSPATTRLGGVLVQLVEIPGLIEGAADDRGRRPRAARRAAERRRDPLLPCLRPRRSRSSRRSGEEVAAAGIELPALLAATKCDEAPPP